MELSEQPLAVKHVVQFGLYVLQEWQQFPQERLRRLVRSMTRRVTELHTVDILVIDFYALHIRTIDAFKSS
jgi:hypothetical protein